MKKVNLVKSMKNHGFSLIFGARGSLGATNFMRISEKLIINHFGRWFLSKISKVEPKDGPKEAKKEPKMVPRGPKGPQAGSKLTTKITKKRLWEVRGEGREGVNPPSRGWGVKRKRDLDAW